MQTLKVFIRKVILYLSSIAILFSLTACNEQSPKNNQAPTSLPVSVMPVQKGTLDSYTKLSGLVKPSKLAYVVTTLPGKVDSAFFKVGDRVSEGELLFTVDSTEMEDGIRILEEQLKVAEANLSMAQTGVMASMGSQHESKKLELKTALISAEDHYAVAKEAFDSATLLLEAGVINRLQYNQVRNQYQQAMNGLNASIEAYELYLDMGAAELRATADDQYKQAKAAYDMLVLQIESAKKKLSYCRITSPMDGTVMTKDIVPGCMLSNTMVPYIIMNEDTVEVMLSVTEKLIGLMEEGQEVAVAIQSAANSPFQGEVETISPAVDQNTITYQVSIAVPNPEHLIKPGMTAEVDFLTGHHENVILVPISAVLSNDGGSFVYIVQKDRAVQKPVITGLSDDAQVEILKGLNEKELLVVKGQHFLSPNDRLVVSEEVH